MTIDYCERRRRTVLPILALSLLPCDLDAQNHPPTRAALEEIVVTATRVETNLQETPMSIQAFSGEDLDLAGIDADRDLGIMVPNVVINPVISGRRHLSAGCPALRPTSTGQLLQRRFSPARLRRDRARRGVAWPARDVVRAQYQRRRRSNSHAPPGRGIRRAARCRGWGIRSATLVLAVDLPLTDRLTSKWTAARDRNGGFMESQTAPFTLGGFDNTVLRADFLWEPTNRFSMRFNVNEENRDGSPARIVRISNTRNPVYIAYNVLAGNPDYLAQARAINPAFPAPPFELPFDRFTPETHQQGYSGGQLGKWQTRSDNAGPTVIDQQYATVTVNWDITPRFALESLTAYLDSRGSQIAPYDGSEFTHSTDMIHDHYKGVTQELHLIGDFFEGRLQSMFGLYYNDNSVWGRPQSLVVLGVRDPDHGPESRDARAARRRRAPARESGGPRLCARLGRHRW